MQEKLTITHRSWLTGWKDPECQKIKTPHKIWEVRIPCSSSKGLNNSLCTSNDYNE